MSAFESTAPDGTISLTCSLEGVNCAGCIAKIERHLNSVEGVVLARGNATTRRMRLVWDDAKTNSVVLFDAIGALGYTAHPFDPTQNQPERSSLLGPLAVAGFVMMNIMALSVSVWVGLVTDMGSGTMGFMHWLSAALTAPAVFYSGAVFYGPALRALRHGRMTMDTPITIAIFVTYAASLFETLRGNEHVYFDAVVSLIFLLLIGRVLEQKLSKRSGMAAENLRAMMNVTARRKTHSGHEDVPADLLMPGDEVLIEAGEQVPADGILLNNLVQVDESPLTGESLPVNIVTNAPLAAGCLLVTGPAEMRVTHVGSDAQLSRIAALAEEAAAHKGQMQELADRFARGYVPLVLIGGAVGFIWWYFIAGADFGEALMIAVAVLVVTCPCAAGLATPAVSARAVDILMQAGIVLKSGAALERLAQITQVVADKTGTLTTAQLQPDADMNTLRAAAPLAAGSSHPLARALSGAVPMKAASDLSEVAGQGMRTQDGRVLGSAAFVGVASSAEGPELWFQQSDQPPVRIGYDETPRDGLDDFLQGLRQQGLPLTILSGDREGSVARFAKAHGITDWKSEQSPEAKLHYLRSGDEHVLMLGDGINDAPALSAASVSASFAQATQVAQSAADLVLLQANPARLIPAIELARQAHKLILQNLRFAALYNIITVPLALAGWLSPLLAALLMATSSVIVLANGLRLRMQG
ncbi:heavy metal translocating P-type ATPase [Sulfitobacter sp. SK012]|uniref:heavy metal translocating P-type ATPase n=1 Tax=Sulfitobacter sp. SK012 TaxID=1389005 RepID=UPI000E0A3949|nr:cation-translocating P-type ATPase [Sulfitobacter sp. SK012]AXI48588.1 heavy metal translocating P-type ATPase [Sulfitobacter sp. SK012]